MKKIKLGIIGIIILLVLVFAYQNQVYFKEKHILGLDLLVTAPLTTPEVSNAIICLASFFLGIVMSFIMSLSGRVKRKRLVKKLNSSLADCEKEIKTLKSKIEASEPPKPTEESMPAADEQVAQAAE